jgi:hypothetical protein
MQRFRVWQIKPRLGPKVAPVEPMTLASAAQSTNPLPPYFEPNPMELALTVVEPEVLIEASQHNRQVTLLVPALPVHVPFDPLAGTSQELTAALHASI